MVHITSDDCPLARISHVAHTLLQGKLRKVGEQMDICWAVFATHCPLGWTLLWRENPEGQNNSS